jgi:hypothetical protein
MKAKAMNDDDEKEGVNRLNSHQLVSAVRAAPFRHIRNVVLKMRDLP